jgi:hypothetical protein
MFSRTAARKDSLSGSAACGAAAVRRKEEGERRKEEGERRTEDGGRRT